MKKNVNPPPPPLKKKNSACSLLTISEQEVKKIPRELNTEKLTVVDMMPPKLVKLVANYLARPLSQSINNSIKKGCFPKMQQLPQLLPDDKKLCIKFLSNKCFELLLKSLRKYTKNKTCGKYEQSISPFYLCV